MRDTAVALPDATRDGATLFAATSDRELDEAQVVERRPGRRWTRPPFERRWRRWNRLADLDVIR